MGKETNEKVIDDMESILGVEKSITDESSSKETKTEDTATQTLTGDESLKDETPTTTIVTNEQLDINKEIAVIDSKIKELENVTVDTNEFFNNLEEHLSEDEQALEFSDKPAYMKLINKKATEYEASNSKADEIETLKAEKQEKQLIYERQASITQTVAKYPDYNHKKMMDFFENDLTKAQQTKIFDSSKSYTDVYEKTYEKHLELNPTTILQEPSPNIPNVNNARKDTPKNSEIETGLKSEDELLQDALGL